MANFTALKTAINNAIKTNGNEEITGAILQAILDAMVETLGDSAITDLENAITTEVTNRQNAVGGVADDLAAEVQARANKDNQLDNRINAEESNRAIADAALNQTINQGLQTLGSQLAALINTEVTNRENAISGVAADLNAEALARANKDNQLDDSINAEVSNRQNADAALNQTMNQGFQTLGSQISALNAAISALNAAYQNGFLYGGIATPSSSPSNNKCFYIALQGGIYTNFGGVGVVEGINIIKNDSGWKVEHIYDQTTLLNEFYLLRQQVIRAISSIDPIVIQGDVTNAPDEEDLTSDAQHLLKFKDRAYSPLNFSGLGMKILRKNIAPLSDSAAFNGFVEGVTAEETLAGTPELIFWDRMNTRFVGIKDGVYYLDWTDSDNYVPVSTSLVYMYNGTPYQWTGSDFIVDETEVPNLVNCLTQDMINEANTIYIIRYDYTLKEDITIPANCVLEFDGGSISGTHTITGTNTGIKAGLIKIFSTDVTLADSWNVAEAYPEWFGAKGDGVNDDRLPLQKAIDFPANDVRLTKKYRIASYYDSEAKIGVHVPGNKRIIGVSNSGYDIAHALIAAHNVEYNTFVQLDGRNITIKDLLIFCKENDDTTSTNIGIGTSESWCPYLTLDKVFVIDAIEVGFYLHTFICTMTRCLSSRAKIGYQIGGSSTLGNGTTLTMTNCYAYGCTTNGYLISRLSYSSLISCAADGCGVKDGSNDLDYVYKFQICRGINLISCGQEGGGYSFKAIDCFSIISNACSFANGEHNENPTYSSANHISIESSYSIKFTDCILCTKIVTDSQIITTSGVTRSIKFENCMYRRTNESLSDITYTNVTNGINGGCIVEHEYDKEYDVVLGNFYSIESFNDYTLTQEAHVKVASDGNKNLANLININGKLIFDGENQILTITSKPCIIRNCKKIIFKNCIINKTQYADIAKAFVIENSDVEFDNCSVNIVDTANLVVGMEIINSSVAFNLSDIDAPVSKIAVLNSSTLTKTVYANGIVNNFVFYGTSFASVSSLDKSIKNISYSYKYYIGAGSSQDVENLEDSIIIVQNFSRGISAIYYATSGEIVSLSNNDLVDLTITNPQPTKLHIENIGSATRTVKVLIIKYESII